MNIFKSVVPNCNQAVATSQKWQGRHVWRVYIGDEKKQIGAGSIVNIMSNYIDMVTIFILQFHHNDFLHC